MTLEPASGNFFQAEGVDHVNSLKHEYACPEILKNTNGVISGNSGLLVWAEVPTFFVINL